MRAKSFLWAVALLAIPLAASAQTASDLGNAPSVISQALTGLENGLTSAANSRAGALVPFAMKFLAGSYALLLSWMVLQWFFESKQLASLFGTFLNVTLRFCMIASMITPMFGTSGYGTAIGTINGITGAVASAVSGSGPTSTSGLLTGTASRILQVGGQSLLSLFQAASNVTSSWSLLSAVGGDFVMQILAIIAILFVSVGVIVLMVYAIYNLGKALLYGALAFSLGTALGPFFIATFLLPFTNKMGMTWINFMFVAGFVKIVAAFLVGTVTGLLPTVLQSITLNSTGVTFMSVLAASVGLLIVYALLAWILGSTIGLANSMLPGNIGSADGAGALSAAANAMAAAAGVVAAAGGALKAAGASALGGGASKDGAGNSGGDSGGGGSSGGGGNAAPPGLAGVNTATPAAATAVGAPAGTASVPASATSPAPSTRSQAVERFAGAAKELGPAAKGVGTAAVRGVGAVLRGGTTAAKAVVAPVGAVARIAGAADPKTGIAKAYATGRGAFGQGRKATPAGTGTEIPPPVLPRADSRPATEKPATAETNHSNIDWSDSDPESTPTQRPVAPPLSERSTEPTLPDTPPR